jgi:hypothetical protein
MTPQLQAAIIAIQPLTPPERQQLLQLLTQNTPITLLKQLSNQFWQGTPILHPQHVVNAQLLLNQTPITLRKISDLKTDFWPEDDSIEDFLLFRKNKQEAA